MFDHLSTYATDYVLTRDFYIAAFEPLGYTLQEEFVASWNKAFPTQRMCAFGPAGHMQFWVIETKDAYTPRHVAFCAENAGQVRAFYEASLESGAKDNGKPGLRPAYHPDYFAAFVIDPDGNNIEAVSHQGDR